MKKLIPIAFTRQVKCQKGKQQCALNTNQLETLGYTHSRLVTYYVKIHCLLFPNTPPFPHLFSSLSGMFSSPITTF